MASDTSIPPQTVINRGLDLSSPDTITPEERAIHDAIYLQVHGRAVHPGLNFWFEMGRPGPVKRYRQWSGLINQPPGEPLGHAVMILVLYGVIGYEEGIRYMAFRLREEGLTEAEQLEAVSLLFLWGGPRAMEAYTRAVDGVTWPVGHGDPHFADGWAPDHEALLSGLDFSSPTLSAAEAQKLADWHLRWQGGVPGYVTFMSKYAPDVLKAYRARLEDTLFLLPKQLLPYVAVGLSVVRGSSTGIREAALWAKGFGMSREDTVRAACWGSLMGGAEGLSAFGEAAGDVFDSWM